MKNNYLGYAESLGASEKVKSWINTTLLNYLQENPELQDEIEHIIDYFVSPNAPKKIDRVSYTQAVTKSKKWVEELKKEGNKIKELSEDTETVLDFKDGFKIVKLIGKNAYKREGALMSHCVASYFGNGREIYSLRDKNNNPHCTMEKDQQVKGKGNGDIHPKYISYVVKFLEFAGMTVGDNEMSHLGYVNIESILPDIDKDIKKHLYADKYLPKSKKDEITVNGQPKVDLEMLSIFDLIEDNGQSIKVAFDIPLLVSGSIELIRKLTKKRKIRDWEVKSGGYDSKLAGGNYSQLAGGNGSKLAGGDDSQLAGGYDSQLAGGYDSQLAGGNYSKLAGGYDSKLAGGDDSQLAGGNGSKLAGGNYSKLAGGNGSKLAGGNYSKLAGGNGSKLAGGNYSKLEIGKNGIAVGDNGSKIKGELGSVLVLVERDDYYKITTVKAVQVDGKKIKENVWYELKKGKFVEVKE